MVKITIVETGEVKDIPESWEEMTNEQVRFVIKLYFEYEKTKDYELFLYKLISYFAPIQGVFKKNKSGKQNNTNALIVADVLFYFLFEFSEEGAKLSFNSIKQCLPVFSSSGVHFYGPDDLLFDLSFAEFRSAITEMNDFFNGDKDSLYRFAACLYRPQRKNYKQLKNSEKWDGQRKEPFNANRISIHSETLKNAEEWKLKMILLWFCNCIKHIQENDIIIDGKTINFNCLFSGSENTTDNNLGWLGVLFSFAEKGVYGDVDKTDSKGLYDILLLMLDNYNESKRLEKIK